MSVRVAPVALAAVLVTGLATPLRATDQDPVPLESGLEERVEVQLVLVDVVVMDRRDRTVAGLGREDFELRVDGRPVPLASVDVRCPDGPADDPRGGEIYRTVAAEDRTGVPPAAADSSVVLVFDYFHMHRAAETLDAARRAVEATGTGGVPHLVASLGETVRIEAPPTRDTGTLLATFDRMRDDRALWAGQYGRLTERRFFDRVEVLLDLLERIEGRKAVVLFSGPFLPDGFFHDPAFRRLSAMSARARTALYTIDTGGLRTPLDPNFGPLGGPEMLRRLAHETGGRPTADTNDLGLAYARARRDLRCTYTLGFYDRSPRPDRTRRVWVGVSRPGHRAIHSDRYVIRSPERKRRSLVRTASMAPEMFRSDALRGRVFPLGPDSVRRWDLLTGIEIDPQHPDVAGHDGPWRLEGRLRSASGTVLRKFRRDVLPGADSILFERLRAGSGRFLLGLVLSHPERREPLTTTVEIELPEIPIDRPLLVGPHLGAAAGSVEVQALRRASEQDTRLASLPVAPRLSATLASDRDAGSWLRVCRAGWSDVVAETVAVERHIETAGGVTVVELEPAELRLTGNRGVRCADVIDRLPLESLPPATYHFVARHGVHGLAERRSVRFEVTPP